MTQLRDPDRRRALLISILLHLFVLLMIIWLYQRPEPVPLESFLVIDVGESALAEEETQAPAADAPAPQAAEALVEADEAGEPQEQAPETAPPAQIETPAEPVAELNESQPEQAAETVPPEETPPEAAQPEPVAEPEPASAAPAEPAPPVETAPPSPQPAVTPEADAPEAQTEATALPEIEDPLPTVPSAQALPVPTPNVSAEVVPTRTLATEPTASVDPAQAVPVPEVEAEVDVPDTVPVPQPQVEATVEDLEPTPQAVPTPQAQASVSEAQSVPNPQAQTAVQEAQNVPAPQVSASVSTAQTVPTPQATVSVSEAQSVPNPNASANVSAAQSVPNPDASADVSTAQSIPDPQATASVAGARAVPSPNASAAVAEARAVPNPSANASVDADIVAAAAAGDAADSTTNADAPEGATVTAGQTNNRPPGGNSERSGQTTAQEGASEDNLGLAAGPEGSDNPTGAPIARVPYRENRDRPLTVMLDNVGGYPQYGLLEASMIVEMPVEGGQSRLMTVYDRIDPAQVGPIRSARDYFHTLSENMNGILVHVGGSPSALAAIEQSRLPSIDAMSSGEVFRREGGEAPYNTFSSGLDLRQTVNRLSLNNSRVVSGTTYRPEDDTTDVSQIDIAYSGVYDTGFRFVENLNLYRWVRNGADASDALGEAVYVDAVVVANIIAQPIPGDTEGRLYIPLEASRATLYLRGKAIQGRWDPEGGVRFVTSLGEQIDLTPFKTWVVFTPETSEVVAQ